MKLVKEPIKLPTTYTVPLSSVKSRDKLIARSQRFRVGKFYPGNVATNSRELARVVKDAKAVCAPILRAIKAAGDAVRKLQNDFIAPAQAEIDCCEALLVEEHKRELERVAAEETARQVEIQRLEALRRDAEEKAEQLQADLDVPERTMEALRADMAAHDAQQAMEALILAPPPEPARPKGVSIQRRMRADLIGENSHERLISFRKLDAARPDLMRFNAELGKLEVNWSEINSVCVPEMPVPGLDLRWETTAETRAVA